MKRNRVHNEVEGAAAVEAVILLPVLGVLLAGVLLLAQAHGAAAEARAQARRCAWLHALNGCADSPPAGCEEVIAGLRGGKASAEHTATIDEALGSESGSGHAPGLLSLLGDGIGSLFGTATQASATRDVPWRGLGGSDAPTVAVGGRFTVLCNPGEGRDTGDPRRRDGVLRDAEQVGSEWL